MRTSRITSDMINDLRKKTGVSMGKCKKFLEIAEGDIEKAIDLLREEGMASAIKKEGRETKEGVIIFTEVGGVFSFIVLNAETEPVVQNEKFQEFAATVAKQAAKTKPKDLQELLAQPFAQDTRVTVDQQRAILMQILGENIQLRQMEIVIKAPTSSLGIYSHMGGKKVAFVEIEGSPKSETLAQEIAMHIVATAPDYLRPEDVPLAEKEKEQEVARAQNKNKSPEILNKIVENKLKDLYARVCLLSQPFVKEQASTISDLLNQESKKSGCPLTIKKFGRFEVGA